MSDGVSLTEQCIFEIKNWMDKNKLKLNESKTEFLIFSKPSSLKSIDRPSIFLNNCQVEPSTEARNLGVVFDENLNLESHINILCRSKIL